ncbi:unnamed protein product [Chrysoparadoxa australica]
MSSNSTVLSPESYFGSTKRLVINHSGSRSAGPKKLLADAGAPPHPAAPSTTEATLSPPVVVPPEAPPAPATTSTSAVHSEKPAPSTVKYSLRKPTPQKKAGGASLASYKEFLASQPYVSPLGQTSTSDGSPSPSPTPASSSTGPPILTGEGYYTVPAMSVLSKWSDSDLAHVKDFKIGKEGCGSIEWLESVDIRGINLDELVQISHKHAAVYDNIDPADKPPVGEGLNKPTIITLLDVFAKEGKEDGYEHKLARSAAKNGADHESYDAASGTWVFRTYHFSRYGIDDSDEEDDPMEVPPKTRSLQPKALAILEPKGSGKGIKGALRKHSGQKEAQRVTFGDGAASTTFGISDSDSSMDTGEHEVQPGSASYSQQPNFEAPPEPQPQQLHPKSLLPKPSPYLSRVVGVDSNRAHQLSAAMHVGAPPRQALPSRREVGALTLQVGRPSSSPPPSTAPANTSMSMEAAYALPARVKQVPMHVSPSEALPPPQHGSQSRGFSTPLPESVQAFYPSSMSATLKELAKVGLAPGSASTDLGLRLGRSFRASWGPSGQLVHTGKLLGQSKQCGTADGLGKAHKVRIEVVRTTPSRGFLAAEQKQLYEPALRVHQRFSHCVELLQGISMRGEAEGQHRETADNVQAPLWRLASRLGGEYQHLVACIQEYPRDMSKGAPLPPVESPEWVIMQSWKLVNALWGQEEGHDELDLPLPPHHRHAAAATGAFSSPCARRRAAVSEWLEGATLPCLEMPELIGRFGQFAGGAGSRRQSGGSGGTRTEELYAHVLSLLTVHRLEQASAAVAQAGALRLSTIISLAACMDTFTRNQLAMQCKQWKMMGADSPDLIPPSLLRIYTLLSGQVNNDLALYCGSDPEAGGGGSHKSLDWLRQLGLCLWYQSHDGGGDISAALAQFEAAMVNKYAVMPKARYLVEQTHVRNVERLKTQLNERFLDGGNSSRSYCLLYHLLRLYVSDGGGGGLPACLDPLCSSPDPLDYRNSWHLQSVMHALALPYPPANPTQTAAITDSLVFQLLSEGMWQWAIYVLLHQPDHKRRSTTVREMLLRHGHSVLAISTPENEAIKAFLVDELAVPVVWLQEAAAVRAGYEGRHGNMVHHLIGAGLYAAAQDAMLTGLAPRWVFRGHAASAQLKDLLEVLEKHADWSIPSWTIGGAVYLTYLRLADRLSAMLGSGVCDEVQLLHLLRRELEELRKKISALKGYGRGSTFAVITPDQNTMDRVCRLEMETKVTQAILLVESSLNRIPTGKVVAKELPMLTDQFMQPLVSSQ